MPSSEHILFASDNSNEAVTDAKAYIARFGLTHDDVSLLRRDGMTLVVAKRNVRDKLIESRPGHSNTA